ncbi:MAG: peptidylprolyl isomerase [Saprospiraceae bacterium]|nr:peptidylprolyl isomerase [Saprospiraceae bacterium]MBP7680128.1 peptidylprolyl isomerase [Saprospiraceae bacterium]
MALIGKIRDNSWILIGLVGLALAGFILMDMVSWSNRGGMGGQFTMGKVAGKTIDWNDFQRSEQILYQNAQGDPFGRRNSLWNFFVEEAIVSKEADALGLGVGKDELKDLQFGNNLSPIIQQRFGDPNTRQVDVKRLMEIKQAIEKNQLPPQLREYWAEQEKEIIKDRLQSKLTALVSKSLYLPTWQANQINNEQNTHVSLNYVKIPFDKVGDAQVKVTDAELEKYLADNKAVYTRDEETRRIAYVSFLVRPTAADSAKINSEVAALVAPFRETTDDSSFVENNLGIIDGNYFRKDQLSPAIADIVMTQPAGSVYGPYQEGSAIKAVKILDRKVVADSVRSRHILIGAQDAAGLATAQKTIDSLKTLVESGAVSFDSLAARYGQDATRTKGGDLGYAAPGNMVKEFNDLIFFRAEPKKYYTVTTQFGVHLVQVTDKKSSGKVGARLAYLQQPLIPSKETQDSVYQVALEYVSKHRTLEEMTKTAATNPAEKIETTGPLAKNDFHLGTLGGGNSGREVVRWAFGQGTNNNNVNVGDVSREIFSFENQQDNYLDKYIVVALKSVQPAGTPTLANVRDEIEMQVKNIKKAELMKGQDLSALATQYGLKIDTASTVAFNAMFVPGIGSEPKLVAAAFSAAPNTKSAIAGNTALFAYQVTGKEQPSGTPMDVATIRRQVLGMQQSQVRGRLMQALTKKANVQDNRAKFF